MRLTATDARTRLAAHDHGVLCTLHPSRGVDAVPVVYAADGDHVGIPVDRVKPKSSSRLQRERNLEADPRAALLVEHWDREDWSRLWWVRAELRWQPDAPTADLATRLSQAYPQYRDMPFTRVLVLRIVGVTGWSATGHARQASLDRHGNGRPGKPPSMTEPSRDQSATDLTMADVAGETAEESVEREREIVGDEPDLGGLVDEDRSQ